MNGKRKVIHGSTEDILLRQILPIEKGTVEEKQIVIEIVKELLRTEEGTEIIKSVFRLGLVSSILKALNDPKLCDMATHCLCNLTRDYGYVSTLVSMGLVTKLLALLHNPLYSNGSIQENIVWIFSNMAAEGSEMRDSLLQAGILSQLLRFIKDEKINQDLPDHVKEVILDALNCFCIDPSPAFLESYQPLVKVLVQGLDQLFQNKNLTEIHVKWINLMVTGLIRLSKSESLAEIIVKALTKLCTSNVLHNVFQLSKYRAIEWAARLSTGSSSCTEYLVEADIVTFLVSFTKTCLKSSTPLKNAYCALSNIVVDDIDICRKLVKDYKWLEKACQHLISASGGIQFQIVHCLNNIIGYHDENDVRLLLSQRVLVYLVACLLQTKSPQVALTCLMTIRNILRLGALDEAEDVFNMEHKSWQPITSLPRPSHNKQIQNKFWNYFTYPIICAVFKYAQETKNPNHRVCVNRLIDWYFELQ